MKNKQLILAAKLISVLFAPHYFPLLCLLVLMAFSYMKALPIDYKLIVLALVYVMTIALPVLLISLYRKVMGLRHHELSRREMRTMPYIISIGCYLLCYYAMDSLYVPHFIVSVVVASLIVQIICLIVNGWHKVSSHSAAAGAMNGALIAFSFIFHFNPVWWLCLTLVIAGCVGSSRLVLRHHTMSEVGIGFGVGFVTGFLTILLS